MNRFRSVSALALTLLFAVASTAAAQEELVIGFIVEADSVYQASGEQDLSQYIRTNAPMVGAAVGTLLEIGFEVGMEGDTDSEADNLEFAEKLARIHAELGESEGPLAYVQRYRGWSAEDRAAKQTARNLESQAVQARGEGDYELALAKYAEAAAIYERIGDTRAMAVLWGSRGIVHFYRSDFESMEQVYGRALELRREIDDRILVGKTLNGMGTVNFMAERYPAALEWYRRAVDLRRQTGDTGGLVTSLTYLGNVYYELGELPQAVAEYTEAESHLRLLGESADKQRSELLNNRANVLFQMGEFTEALVAYRDALELFRRGGDEGKEFNCRVNIAALLDQRGRYGEAMHELERCAQILEGRSTPERAVQLLLTRSIVLKNLGDLEGARDDLLQARAVVSERGMPAEGIEVQLGLAELYTMLGAADRALELALDAVATAEEAGLKKLLCDAWIKAGGASQNLGDYEAMQSHFAAAARLAAEIQDERNEVSAKIGTANALALLGREEEARASFREAIRLSGESDRSLEYVRATLGIAHTWERDSPDKALRHYREALAALERMRSQAGDLAGTTFFVNETGYLYQEIARYYAGLHAKDPEGGWAAEALSVTEKSRSRGLLDRLGETGVETTVLTELQTALSEHALLLQYSLGDSASFLWAIDRNQVQLVELPPKREIEPRVEQLRSALAQPGAADSRLIESSRSLYETLLGEVADRLASARELVIVPDAGLHLLPFELLLATDPAEGEAFGDRAFLARSCTTSYAPSSTVWLRLKGLGESPSKIQLLAVGNPDFSSSSGVELAPLPYSQDEVERVGRRVANDQRRLLLGTAATETALRAGVETYHPLILHLATHGLVDPAEAQRSCVALTADAENDGFLYSPEIEALQPAAALVVLSACETATGRLRRGEGVVGLGRSFLAAGSHGVVASLWPVSDESTALLMDSFYEHLLAGKGAAESLQLARGALLADERYAHPYHWAAFILIGDASAPWAAP